MFTTAAAVLGLTLAQPPAAAPAGPFGYNTRAIDIPIEYRKDQKDIRRVELWASVNRDGVWKPVANAPPTDKEFHYTAPDDGEYWFHLVVVDLKGAKDPADVTAEPDPLRVLIDTKPPRVAFTTARREGEHVVVEWKVDEKYPNEAATAVQFQVGGPAGEWTRVDLPPNATRTGLKFPVKTAGPVTVKVTVADWVGNPGEAVQDIPAAGPDRRAAAPAASPVTLAGGLPPPASIVPPAADPAPLAPAGPAAPAYQPPAYQPPAVAAAPPTYPGANAPGSPAPITALGSPAPITALGSPASITALGSPAPIAAPGPAVGALPAFDPKATAAPPPAAFPTTPAAAPGGFAPAGSPAPAAEAPAVRVINTPQFPLTYNVEQQGGSKIGRIDLYVTRDEGRSWRRWSQHPGGEGVVRVNLAVADNTQPEGSYGFRLVSVSGAGLSEDAPAPGEAPDLRLVVDLTRPAVVIRAPTADPTAPDVLVLNWQATDANFGDDPITLEWSDGVTGPWRPVATGADGPVQPVGAVTAARRLANTGQFGWRVPAGLPPRVFLKLTARDAAGNTTELVTRDPVLIDLVKPKVRITGLGGPR